MKERHEQLRGREREAKQKAREEAREKAREELRRLGEKHVPGAPLDKLGMAYWGPEAVEQAPLGHKVIGGALFGGIGVAMASRAVKKQSFGIVAVTEEDVIVVWLGRIDVNERLTLEKLREAWRSYAPSTQKAPTTSVEAEWRDERGCIHLALRGGLDLDAGFPVSCGRDNPDKGINIAGAIVEASKQRK